VGGVAEESRFSGCDFPLVTKSQITWQLSGRINSSSDV
jgi:hypothetical protein